MISIYILLIETIICLGLMYILYKLNKIEGLYYYTIIALITSIIGSFKSIEIYNATINLGIIPFSSLFVISNILTQKNGLDENKKITNILIFTLIITFITLNITALFKCNNLNIINNNTFNNMLFKNTRLFLTSALIIYLIILNSKLYYNLKKEQNQIWISSVLSSIIIQFITTITYTILLYSLELNILKLVETMVIRYIIGIFASIAGTIIIYIISDIKENRKW